MMKSKLLFVLSLLLLCSSSYSGNGYNQYQRNSSSYHNPIKKIIREENKQEGRMLEIRFLRRPLDADFLGFQDMSKGTISHVQIVAYDKATGKYYDDFGYTGNFLKDEKGKVFKEFEDGIIKKYELKSLGSIEMSSECYKKVKNATIDKLEDIYYAPLNNVDVKTYVALGAGGGTQIAGLAGAVVGSVGGLLSAADTYSQSGRKNYKVVSDDKRQMSFPGVNCQTAADIFIAIGEMMYTLGEIATWDVKDKYIQPGPHQKNNGKNLEGDFCSKTKPEMITCDESKMASDSFTSGATDKAAKNDNVAKTDADDAKDSNDKGKAPESVTVDTKDYGGVGVRGWCKCVNNDDDVIAVGFGGKTSKASYTDEEHELMRSRFKASRFHSYVYFICRQCGRCSTKGKIGGSGPLKNLSIFDFTLAEQFEEEKKTKVMSDSDYRQHNAMMIRVNQKLLAIPEGQIVIPGSCFCLKPDLITVGLATSDKFQVCRYCGWKWVSAKE